MSKKAKERITWLKAEIWKHAKKYYVENAPEISDYEYDKLFSELVTLEEAHSDLCTPDSPTFCALANLEPAFSPATK